MHLPNASLFRAYDVRGIVGETLDAADFISIGHAFASHVADRCQTRTPLIVAVRDGRASSPTLLEAFIEGMLRAGAHVLDGGITVFSVLAEIDDVDLVPGSLEYGDEFRRPHIRIEIEHFTEGHVGALVSGPNRGGRRAF